MTRASPDSEQRASSATLLRKNGPFRWYWSAAAVSGTGSAISLVVLPIFAVASLDASPAQMALLGAVHLMPALTFQIPIAMWADSAEKNRTLLLASMVSAGMVAASIPILWWMDLLTFEVLLLAAGLEAVATVSISANMRPVLVKIVQPEMLVGASGYLNGTRSATDVAGQALGGGLLRLVAAPIALLIDALSYVGGAVLMAMVRMPIAPKAAERSISSENSGSQPLSERLREVREIAGGLLRKRDIWSLMGIALSNGISEAVFVILAINTFGINPGTLGLLLAVGALGGVLGGFLADPIATRLGRWTVPLGVALTVWSILPVAMAESGPVALLSVVNFELAGAFAGTIVLATVFGQLQAAAGERRVARTMAIAENGLQVAALIGLGVGAAVGSAASPRSAMVVGGGLLSVTLMILILHLWRRGAQPRTLATSDED